MEVATGGWLGTVDYSVAYPNHPLVPVGIVEASPFAAALRIPGLGQLTLFIGDEQHGYYGGGAYQVVQTLAGIEDTLLQSGPEAADAAWYKALGRPKGEGEAPSLSVRKYESGNGYSSYGRSEGYWSRVATLPSLAGLSSVSAALYLAAIGKTKLPVPVGFARALLDPAFSWPHPLNKLSELSAPNEVRLNGLRVDKEHRLVFGGHDESHEGFGYRRDATVPEQAEVVSEGWRRRDAALFPGYPVEVVERDSVHHRQHWEFDHDGARLVRLHASPRGESPTPQIPVVELREVMPDVVMLANDVRANPAKMLNTADRAKHWAETRAGISPVAMRIVETAMTLFTPWPYPFRVRTQQEQQLRVRESNEKVVALFDRLLDAPLTHQPTDLTAYFLSLIDKRRAEFAAWPEVFANVWGFKIKTGDHNWINGRIWNEPGEQDVPTDPMSFKTSAARLEQTRYRDRYRHRVHLRTGNLRCYIERDDT